MRKRSLVYILVAIEVLIMRIDMTRKEDLFLVGSVMTKVEDIIMMKEEVLVLPENIQYMGVSRKVLSDLKLLMTGFEMMELKTQGNLLTIGFCIEMAVLEACHLTV